MMTTFSVEAFKVAACRFIKCARRAMTSSQFLALTYFARVYTALFMKRTREFVYVQRREN